MDKCASKLIDLIEKLEDELMTCTDPVREDELIQKLAKLYPLKTNDYDAESQDLDREKKREMEAEQKAKENKRFWPKTILEITIPVAAGFGGTLLCLKHQKDGHLLDVKSMDIGSKMPKAFRFKK